ncbi:MAG: hypothetical protein QXQ50_08840 [Candidatus Bathyarchaeia archaeon]
MPILFYAQYYWVSQYRDVYTGIQGDTNLDIPASQDYWYGKNTLSVDSVPVATESFSTPYSSSYGSYAYVIWRDVGATVSYEWYTYVYYDKNPDISGLDEQYMWKSTTSNVGVSTRIGTFTVPARSGNNPVIIRASYERQVYISVSIIPIYPSETDVNPGSISTTESLGSGWYRDTAQFTANPNYPYYQFDDSEIGRWVVTLKLHLSGESNLYTKSYSVTSRSFYPKHPSRVVAVFYPRFRIYVFDRENVVVSGLSLTINGKSYTTSTSGWVTMYHHPYESIIATVPSPISRIGFNGRTFNNGFWKWQDTLGNTIGTSTTLTISSALRPIDVYARYKVDVVLVDWGGINGGASGGGYGGHVYIYPYAPFYVWEPYLPRDYLTMGVVVSQYNNLVSGVSIKTTIHWTQFLTYWKFSFDIGATTISTKSYTVGFVRPIEYFGGYLWRLEWPLLTNYVSFNYYARSNQLNWDYPQLTYGYTWITGVPDGYEYDEYITYPSQGMLFHADTANEDNWNTGSGFYLAVEYP